MTSIDFRTRFEGDSVDLDPARFLGEHVPALPSDRFAAAGRAVSRDGLAPLTLDVEGEAVTFEAEGGELRVGPGRAEGITVALDRVAFSDLMQDVVSTFALQMSGRATIDGKDLDTFLEWEPVLRCLLDGRPVYEPGTVQLLSFDGAPLDVRRSFRLDDDADEIGHFLTEAGFLHLRDVFTQEEMAAVSAELDAAIAAAEQDDGASWWARTEAGEWYPARILGFNHQSPSLRELLKSERFAAIGTFTGDSFVQRDPDTTDAAEGLLKKIGVVEGISDVSWHKDCALGGHSRHCSGLVVGISVSGAGRESGELGAIAGSHRASTPVLGADRLDLPRVPLPTNTGDVTVHCSCTFHMSRPPVSAERRVVYTGFGLAPRPGDREAVFDPARARRERAAQNDQVKRQQQRQATSTNMARFDL